MILIHRAPSPTSALDRAGVEAFGLDDGVAGTAARLTVTQAQRESAALAERTSIATVGGGVRSGSANEPAALSRIAEVVFTGADGATALPTAAYVTSGFGIQAGAWRTFNQREPTMTVLNDPQAGACLRYLYYQGLLCGNSNGEIIGWDVAGGGTPYSRVFERDVIKLPLATFELQPGQVKILGYWKVGNPIGAGGADLYTVMTGANFGSSFSLDVRMQNINAGWSVSANVAPALITCAQVMTVDFLFSINGIGSADGALDVWVNDVHTHHYTDRVFRDAQHPGLFIQRHWDPVYGGGCSPNPGKTRDDTMLIRRIYISGTP